MRKKIKTKLSKKTKKQILEYLCIRRCYMLMEFSTTTLGEYYKDFLKRNIDLIDNLMLDIETYGVK